MGLFSWFTNKRREKILEGAVVTDEAWVELKSQHPILEGLSEEEQQKLKGFILLFLAEKQILFKEGMEEDEGVTWSIAVQACLPILNLGFGWLDGWKTIYVVPDDFEHTGYEEVAPNAWLATDDTAAGEVMPLGSIALSLPDIEASGWCDGYNVVIHEIAHKLDELDGSFDGRPPLHEGMDRDEWAKIMRSGFESLAERVKRKKGNRRTALYMDEYGEESIDEFFAVATETFFEKPADLKKGYPDVYDQLVLFYKQDPAARLA